MQSNKSITINFNNPKVNYRFVCNFLNSNCKNVYWKSFFTIKIIFYVKNPQVDHPKVFINMENVKIFISVRLTNLILVHSNPIIPPRKIIASYITLINKGRQI